MENSKQVSLKLCNLFDDFLVEFQDDIKRIAGKFKKHFHLLSDDEIYSECNLHLLKGKEKILSTFSQDSDFTREQFKKIAYHYVKNEVVWSHYRVQNKSYNRRRLDGFVETEDGTKTTFEAAIETRGVENEELDNDNLFLQANSKQFFHILTKYCYLLTEKECVILSYAQKGVNQYEISKKLKVTHQAVSAMFLGIQDKLKNFFNFNEVVQGGSHKSITQGYQCMDNFFDKGIEDPVITSRDKAKIKNFILNNPKKYSGAEINKILFNSKYSSYKMQGAIRSLKLTLSTVSKNRPFTKSQRVKMLKLFKSGKCSREVAKAVGITLNSAQRVRGEFVKQRKLDSVKKNIQRPNQ